MKTSIWLSSVPLCLSPDVIFGKVICSGSIDVIILKGRYLIKSNAKSVMYADAKIVRVYLKTKPDNCPNKTK